MNVATNAYFVPTQICIHEKIPPFSSLNAEPYSATINANGTKKTTADNRKNGIAPYPIR